MLLEPVTLRTLLRDRVALAILAGSLLIRLLLSALVGPGFDEAYYHLFAENPAWGYFDHPPFVATVAGIGHALTGVWTPFTLRLGAVLVFTLALPGVYLLTGRLYGLAAARFALLLIHATPFFLAGAGAFVLPDNALMACWIWALVVAERIRNSASPRQPQLAHGGDPVADNDPAPGTPTGDDPSVRPSSPAPGIHTGGEAWERTSSPGLKTGGTKPGRENPVDKSSPAPGNPTGDAPRPAIRTALFLALGVFTGLALLAKYHAVLLPASLVIASLYDRELRRWWLDWRLYAALLVALLVFSPTILWNANNQWISFAEQFGKGGDGEFRLRFDLIGQAIGGQLGYLTPWVGIALWIGAFKRRRPPATGDTSQDSGLKTQDSQWLLAFFLTPVIGMTLIGLTRGILPHWTMPGYLAAFVLAAGGFAWTVRVKRNTLIAVAVNLLLVVLVVVQAWTGLLPLPAKGDPTLDPAGWSASLDSLEARGELAVDDILFVHKWFTGGEIAFADTRDRPVVLLGDKPHMFAWWAPETAYTGRSGVLLTQRRYDVDPDKHLAPRFAHVEPLPLDSVRHRGRWVRMKAWRVTDLQHPRTPPYGPAAISAAGTP